MDVGWVMAIRSEPKEKDMMPALMVSVRRGAGRGVYRIFPGDDPAGALGKKLVGGSEHEVLFLDYVKSPPNRWMYAWGSRYSGSFLKLTNRSEPMNFPIEKNTGHGKGVALGDLNGDGLDDLAIASEHAEGLFGVYYYAQPLSGADRVEKWMRHDIGGVTGTKFDRIELIDFDGDGDLDLLTCEDRENLGVIWYENPERKKL
jgi:hypothetical protein